MDRLGFLVLSILVKYKAFDTASAMSVYEISDMLQEAYKADNIYRKVVKLKKFGCVETGLKDGKAKTFYITEKGKRSLLEAKRTS